MHGLSRIACISVGTIKNLVEGKRPYYKTVKKLIRYTKTMKEPVTSDLFKKIKGERKMR